jgi:predicted ATP-grasp superfamily ATP-dependent carboligase
LRILFTSSRAPVTLELIRALAGVGHEVLATDTFTPTLGSHSRYVRRHFVTPAPRHRPSEFADALLEIVRRERIDWLIPTCEEVFHVGKHHARLAGATNLLCPTLDELDRWHNKFTFQQHAAACGLGTPRTDLVEGPEQLKNSLARYPNYLLKPAYSRFAVRIIANRGQRSGQRPLSSCQPSPAQPWLIQEFVEGENECSYSVVHQGRITAHCAYRTPLRVNAGAGASFQSVDGEPSLEIARGLLAGSNFTGQFSLDFLRTHGGHLCLLECNPRATSAVHLMEPSRLAEALLNPTAALWIEPPGRYQQLLLVVLGQNPLKLLAQPRSNWRRDVILSSKDPLPALMQLSQVGHFFSVSRRGCVGLLEATTEDIEWNGPNAPLPVSALEPSAHTVQMKDRGCLQRTRPMGLFARSDLDRIAWPANFDGDRARRLLAPLIRDGTRAYIHNVEAEVRALVGEGLVFPIAIVNGPSELLYPSYVASPTSQYVHYAKREVELELHDRPSFRRLVPPLLDCFLPVLRWSQIEKAVYVNNWLLSTNLYPSSAPAVLRQIHDLLIDAFPDHAIVFRSVNHALNGELANQLLALGYRAVFSRQVYLLDPRKGEYRRKKSFCKDRSLARHSPYSWVESSGMTESDCPRLKRLYDDLYLDKYSRYNPQFSEAFFRAALKQNWLELWALHKDNRIDGVLGFMECQGVMTTPLIGYDRSLPEECGLYRLISLKLVEEAARRGLILHQSSGASKFKMHRGSEPFIEFSYVFDRHLPYRRRLPWQLLEKLSKHAIVPLMRRLGL